MADDLTLGELGRRLIQITQDFTNQISLLRSEIKDMQKGSVPREVYEIDRRNTSKRLDDLDQWRDAVEAREEQKRKDDEAKADQQRRDSKTWRYGLIAAAITVFGGLVGALIDVLAH